VLTLNVQSNSEKALGELGAPKKFIIDTKAPGFAPHCHAKDNILQAIDKQLALLGVDSVGSVSRLTSVLCLHFINRYSQYSNVSYLVGPSENWQTSEECLSKPSSEGIYG
jgi:hypothetical protein